ncbi:MAG: hypothetical protein V4620_15320 [Bacteroidota bacterium]
MQNNYSEDDLLEYIFKETSLEKTAAIELAISQSTTLQSQYFELLDSIDLLNKTYIRPSEDSVEAILQKAKDALQQNVD